jgi:hypothetical protein
VLTTATQRGLSALHWFVAGARKSARPRDMLEILLRFGANLADATLVSNAAFAGPCGLLSPRNDAVLTTHDSARNGACALCQRSIQTPHCLAAAERRRDGFRGRA